MQALVSSDNTDAGVCVWSSHVVQRGNCAAGRGGAAVLARCSDRGLAVGELRAPAAGRDQGVDAGQRAARVPQQAGEMGR